MDKTCEVFTDMLLYDFLFLAENTEGRNSFDAPRFALMKNVDSTDKTLILYDTEKLERIMKMNPGMSRDFWLSLAAMITLRPSDEGCLGAMQVAYVASSDAPEYKGAGSLIYPLASKVFKTPITSDRSTSTSKSGQRNWDRMIATGKLQKVQPLDNFHVPSERDKEKEYVKANPDRSFEVLPGPQTPEKFDDCELAGGRGNSAETAVRYTGAFDTWKSNVGFNPAPLLKRHKEFMEEHSSGLDSVTEWQLIQASEYLFGVRYKGSNG